MTIAPPVILTASDSERLTELSTGAGVFCVEVDGQVTHLSFAPNLQRRITRTAGKLVRFVQSVASDAVLIRAWPTRSKLETSLLLYQLAKEYFPKEYLQRIHLRMPWFVGLLTRDEFPRLISSNRIPLGCEPVVGPFAGRDLAFLYEQEIQSAFLLRRCTETLNPSPQHPGCIYGEMKQCLRPCQCAVAPARYLAEAVDVSAVLCDNGVSARRVLAKARDEAIASLNFESAARLHKQWERLESAAAARDRVIAGIDGFNGLALTKVDKWSAEGCSTGTEGLQIMPMLRGVWVDPLYLDAAQLDNAALLKNVVDRHLDRELQADAQNARNRLEDFALFARWYYSSWREGTWIPFSGTDDPPYRKLLRTARQALKPH